MHARYVITSYSIHYTKLYDYFADTTVVDAEGVPIPIQLTITDMFYTEQTLQTSSAQAVSADGMIIAGYGATKTGNKRNNFV